MRPRTLIRRLLAGAFLVVLGTTLLAGLRWSLDPDLPPDVERVAGADGYATAAAAAVETHRGGAEIVYVATGEDFPDALAAGALLAADGALLLTAPDALPGATADALARLDPEVIVLLGGEAAITGDVARAIAARTDADLRRIAGADRFETAARLAEQFDPGVAAVFVADGTTFADAITAGAAAAHAGGPVLLVAPDGLPTATAQALVRLKPERVVVVGGEAAVPPAVVRDLEVIADVVVRIAGDDRIATAVAVSRAAFAEAEVVHLAHAEAFLDALTGAAGAAAGGGPLLLGERDCVPDQVLDELERLGAERVVLVGEAQTLSPEVAELLPCGREPIW